MLHPQARAAIEAAAGERPVHDPAYDVVAERERTRLANLEQPRPEVHEVRDLLLGGVRVRLFRGDAEAGDRGVVVHLHGGGFVMNDVDVHDLICRHLALESGMAVLSVDYRRPPEHPYPAAPDDVDAVLLALDEEATALDLTGPRFLHGDSAGANLALVAALRRPGWARAIALIYPFIDARMEGGSYATAAGFDAATGRWYWEQYAGGPDRLAALVDDPHFSPSAAGDLSGLPPTLITTAEHDPLRDEGEELAVRIAEAGGVVVCTRYQGMVHGFWRNVDVFDAAMPMLLQVTGFLRLHGR
ncbi:hypothetical protein GCM10027425_07050 [Alteromonas gracilis]